MLAVGMEGTVLAVGTSGTLLAVGWEELCLQWV